MSDRATAGPNSLSYKRIDTRGQTKARRARIWRVNNLMLVQFFKLAGQ